MQNAPLLRTPLYKSHLKLGARMVPFAGYEMPVQYTGVLEETKAVRKTGGLFDVSHMGQFSVHGTDALMQVQKLVTNDLTKLALGQAQYNMLCNEGGGVIDDLVVYRRADDEIFICVNASNRQADYEWMKERLGPDVTLEDESDATALIALQGPLAEHILVRASEPSVVGALKYYWAAETKVFDYACYLSRTGYTGEDGFELYVDEKNAAEIWEKLLELGNKDGLVAAGLGARDTLRLEMGYPLHGHEIANHISPLAAGLGWVVKLERAIPFCGQEALRLEAKNGPEQSLKAFLIEDRRTARQGYPILSSDKKIIGSITSGTFSPHLGAPIALGFVERKYSEVSTLYFDVRSDAVPMHQTKLPFVPPHTKRTPKSN